MINEAVLIVIIIIIIIIIIITNRKEFTILCDPTVMQRFSLVAESAHIGIPERCLYLKKS